MAEIIRHDTIGSTNREAKRLGLGGAPDGTVVLAAEQTEGRGRMGRSWSSPRGGLWMSVIVRFDSVEKAPAPPSVPQPLSIAAGVAAADALAEIFSELSLPPEIIGLGWPNDILVNGRKIAGILTEGCVIEHRAPFAVVGFGINVNNSPESLPGELKKTAISLSSLAGREYPVESAAEKVIASMEQVVSDFRRGALDSILDKWRARSALFGRDARIQPHGGPAYNAVPYDIDSSGGLLVKLSSGDTIIVDADEVTLIRT